MGGATTSIGLIARVVPLPLDDGKLLDDGSPNAKKPATGVTKLELVETILGIMNNSKLSVKVSCYSNVVWFYTVCFN